MSFITSITRSHILRSRLPFIRQRTCLGRVSRTPLWKLNALVLAYHNSCEGPFSAASVLLMKQTPVHRLIRNHSTATSKSLFLLRRLEICFRIVTRSFCMSITDAKTRQAKDLPIAVRLPYHPVGLYGRFMFGPVKFPLMIITGMRRRGGGRWDEVEGTVASLRS